MASGPAAFVRRHEPWASTRSAIDRRGRDEARQPFELVAEGETQRGRSMFGSSSRGWRRRRQRRVTFLELTEEADHGHREVADEHVVAVDRPRSDDSRCRRHEHDGHMQVLAEPLGVGGTLRDGERAALHGTGARRGALGAATTTSCTSAALADAIHTATSSPATRRTIGPANTSGRGIPASMIQREDSSATIGSTHREVGTRGSVALASCCDGWCGPR